MHSTFYRYWHVPYMLHLNMNYVKSVRIQFECGRLRTRKTPNTGTFHAVIVQPGAKWDTKAKRDKFLSSVISLSQQPLNYCVLVSILYISVGDCKGTWTHNYLVRKRIFNQTGQLIELCCESHLYDAIDCMFLSCHVRISKWIHTIVAWISKNSLLETGAISEI